VVAASTARGNVCPNTDTPAARPQKSGATNTTSQFALTPPAYRSELGNPVKKENSLSKWLWTGCL
jgi:hypothetical protein